MLNRTIYQVEDPDTSTLRGAAFLASLALGYLKIDDIQGCVPVARVFRPDEGNSAIYDNLYREFLQFYRKLKGVYSRLNG